MIQQPTGTDDSYMNCPSCGSFNLYRDLRDRVNSCHECGFTHLVGIETVQDAIFRAHNIMPPDGDA